MKSNLCITLICGWFLVLSFVLGSYGVCGGPQYLSTVIGGMTNYQDGGSIHNDLLPFQSASSISFYPDVEEGVFYYSDSNSKIKKVSLSNGIISTFAGTGTVSIAFQSNPATTPVSAPKSYDKWKGTLVWIDGTFVRSYNYSTNQISVIFGGGSGNSNSSVTNPLSVLTGTLSSISVDQVTNDIYISDLGNKLIRKLSGNDNTASIFKTFTAASPLISYCNGSLFVHVSTNPITIQRVTESGGLVNSTTAIGGGAQTGALVNGTSFLMNSASKTIPTKLDCYNDELYWTAGDYRIRKYRADKIVESVFGNGLRGESPDGGVNSTSIMGDLNTMVIDRKNGDIYLSENNYNIRILSLISNSISTFSHYRNYMRERNAKSLELFPTTVAATNDSSGFYFSEITSIKFFNYSTSTVSHFAGTFYIPYSSSNAPPGSEHIGGSYYDARFTSVSSIALDPNGNLYIIDASIIKFLNKSTGLITHIAGVSSGTTCGNNVTATTCVINAAHSLHFYKNELYFATSVYIYKVNLSNGIIYRLLGGGASTADGPASTASLTTILSFFLRPSDGRMYYAQQTVVNPNTYMKLKVYDTVKQNVTTVFNMENTFSNPAIYINDYGSVYYIISPYIKVFTPYYSNAFNGTISIYAGSGSSFEDAETLDRTKFGPIKYLSYSSTMDYLLVSEFQGLRKIFYGCQSNLGGANCDIPYCNSIIANDSKVCNSRGICVGINNCTCEVGYYGSDCELTWCFSIASNDSSVCSSNGNCNYLDKCVCDAGYTGLQCEIPSCFGILANQTGTVCSGNGICSSLDHCICFNASTSLNCSITETIIETTNHTNSSVINPVSNSTSNFTNIDNSTIVNNNVTFENTTSNSTSFETSNTTVANNNTLNGTLSNNSTDSINNTDSFNNTTLTNNSTLNSTVSNNSTNNNTQISNTTNSSNTTQVIVNNSTIVINTTYTSNNTVTTNSSSPSISQSNTTISYTCFGISSLENKVVCSGNGNCIGNDICECLNGYFGEKCNISTCNGKKQDEVSVCNSKGMCSSSGKCVCQSGYGGMDCEFKTCFGISSNDSNVCSGRGTCTDIDSCQCYSIGNVKITGSQCQHLLCKGVYNGVEEYFSNSDKRVCSNHGKCSIDSFSMTGGCLCESGYYGASCGQFDCFGLAKNDSNSCSGHGQCVRPNNCACFNNDILGYYYGSNCSTCHPAYSGQFCNVKTCSYCLNGGTCGNDNSCSCVGNFKGLICGDCKENYFGSTCQTFCKSDVTCNGHGNCNTINGQCNCYSDYEHGFWNGSSCSSCMAGYYGSDCATFIGSMNSNFTDKVYAQIDERFDGITFKIVPPSYYYKNTVSCYNIIHPDDLSLVGTTPKCYWIDKLTGEFKVQFDYDFSNGISNSIIRLNPNVFEKKRSISSISPYISVYLIMPSFVYSPIASIQSSKKVYSTDEEIIFSGTNSYSGDKKELIYNWDINGDSVSSGVLSFVQSSKGLSLKIEKNLLGRGVYKVKLTVKSQVTNQISEADYFNFQIQEYQVPSAVIYGNKDTRFKSTDKMIVIKKSTNIPSQLKDKLVSYEWAQVEGPSIKYRKDSFNNLLIEEFASGTTRYVFKITITALHNYTLFYSDYVIINTEQPELSLSLSLRDSSGVSFIDVNYEDPENNSHENELWTWGCIDSETFGYCGDSIVKKLDELSKNHSSKLSIYPLDDYFKPLSKPTFTLIITKGERTISNSITLGIMSISPPIVKLIGEVKSQKAIVNSQDRISMEVEHSLLSLYSVNMYSTWFIDSLLISESLTSRIESTNSLTTITTVEPTSKAIRVVNRNEYTSIDIKADDLEDGIDHSVRLKVSYVQKNDSSKLSSTEIVKNFKKANKPNRCPCTISPSSGLSMNTEFKFECENYQNEENSISITHGFIDSETGLKVSIQLSKDKTIKIPFVPKSTNEAVTLFSEIKDIQTGESQIIYSNITLSAPVYNISMNELVERISNQSISIKENMAVDGDVNQGIEETINMIVSTSQSIQSLSEKDSNSISVLQTKSLETLNSIVETTKEESSISDSTTSKVVYAIYSMIKNEKKIGQNIIDSSISVLSNLVNQVKESSLEVSSATSQTFVSVVDKLSTNVANLTDVQEQLQESEQLTLLTQKLAISMVSEQPVSADPVILSESSSVVKVDKTYVTDLSNSVITTPEVKIGNSKVAMIYSNISMPTISSDSNPFEQVTYSTIVKENIPKLVNQIIDTNLEVVSPVSTSFSVMTLNSTVIDWTKNVTIQIRVSDSNNALSNISSYSCYDVQPGKLFNNPYLCTVSGYDNATSTISCNCAFSDLFLANVIVVRNNSQREVLHIGGEVSVMSTQDIIILVSVICGSCLLLFICFFVILICRFVVFNSSYSKREMPEPPKSKELKSHVISQPSKLSSARSGSVSQTTADSSLSISMID